MVIVGSGLLPKHFKTFWVRPVPLIGVTLFQAALLPILALTIVFFVDVRTEVAIGLILVAASPGGALSNYYCHLAGLDTALSVVLTAASSVLAFFLMPAVLAISLPVIPERQNIEINVLALVVRLLGMLVLPLVLGMLLRYRHAEAVEASARVVRRLSLVLVVALLALIVLDQWSTTQRIFPDAAWISFIFTIGAALLGWLSSLLLKMKSDQRYTTAVEFAVRNAGIAAVVAASSMGRPELAAFSALFVVFQFPIVVGLLGLNHIRWQRPFAK
jgi:BASS family bile acid:Na+ symporter